MVAAVKPYEEQVAPDSAFFPRQPRSAPAMRDYIGPALAQTGQELQTAGILAARNQREVQLLDDQKALADARLTAAQATGVITHQFSDAQANAPDDPASVKDENGQTVGFTTNLMAQIDKYGQGIVAGAGNPKAQQYLQLHLQEVKNHVLGQSLVWQGHQQGAYNLDRVQQATKAYGSVVAADDTAYQPTLAALHEMVDTTLTPASRAKAHEAVDAAMANSTSEGLTVRDPLRAYIAYSARLGIPEDQARRQLRLPEVVPQGKPVPTGAAGFTIVPEGGTLEDKVSGAAQSAGVDGSTLLTILQLENPARDATAKNPTSSAKGLFQFTDATWARYGRGDVRDADANIAAAAKLAAVNTANLTAQLGREPQGYEVYLAHLLGPGGAAATLAANPATPMIDVARSYDPKNAEAIVNNNAMVGKTVGQGLAMWRDRFAAAQQKVATVAEPQPTQVALADGATMSDAGLALVSTSPYVEPGQEPKLTGKSGLPFVDALSVEKVIQQRHAAMTALNQGNADAVAQLAQDVADHKAMALNGQPTSDPIERSRFVSVLGAVKGAGAFNAYDATRKAGVAISMVGTMPADQAMATYQGLAPDPAQPDTYAERMAAQAVFGREMKKNLDVREADPSAYALRASPSVADAWQQLATAMSDPTVQKADLQRLSDQYASRTLAEQDRLQIAKHSILSDGQKDAIVQQVSTFKGSGDKMATAIAGMADMWGPRWPQVYGEVVASKSGMHVPDSFILIPALTSPAAREEVARLDGVKVDELKKQAEGAKAGSPKDVSEKVMQLLAPFAESLLPNQTNGRTYSAVLSSAEKMALARIVGGASVNDAAAQAAALITDGYDFPNTGSTKRYAVPKAENADLVAAGVQTLNARMSLWNLPSPVDLTGARTPAEADSAWKQRVLAAPQWVTNSDETGLLLYATGADGRSRPVMTQTGQQVGASFDDLRSMVQESAGYETSGFAPASSRSQDMRAIELAQAAAKSARIAAERANPVGRR